MPVDASNLHGEQVEVFGEPGFPPSPTTACRNHATSIDLASGCHVEGLGAASKRPGVQGSKSYGVVRSADAQPQTEARVSIQQPPEQILSGKAAEVGKDLQILIRRDAAQSRFEETQRTEDWNLAAITTEPCPQLKEQTPVQHPPSSGQRGVMFKKAGSATTESNSALPILQINSQAAEKSNCNMQILQPMSPVSSHNSGSTSANPSSKEPHFSFAQLVDPNEGTELNFIPTQVINGTKCTQLEKSDVNDEIQYWQSAVLYTVLGANPPFEVMKGYFNRIWAAYAIDRILYVRKGVFLVRFANLQDKIAVEKRGFYFFDSKPMLVKGWNPHMDLQSETIRSLPLWVQLPALDIKYWGTQSLSKIGSLLGNPIKTDKHTRDKQVIRYARLLIEMPIEGPFPEYIEFFNEDSILVRQPVTYEWLPTKCTHCSMLGHTEEVCKKRKDVRTEWRPKAKAQAPAMTTNVQPTQGPTDPSSPLHHFDAHAPQAPLLNVDRASNKTHSDEFTTVSKGASPNKLPEQLSSPIGTNNNRFKALIEDHILDMSPGETPIPPPHDKHRQLEC